MMSWTSMFKWATFREILLPSWWEKYLSKRSPLKHTCSWHDKLIVLWILNRQAKISLRIKYSITTVFQMILWNFLEHPCLVCLKMIMWLRKQTHTQQLNAWDTKILLDCSSLIVVYYCYILAWHFLLSTVHKIFSSRS